MPTWLRKASDTSGGLLGRLSRAFTLELAHRLFPPNVLEPDETLLNELDGRSRVPYRVLVWERTGLVGFVRFARLTFGPVFVVHIGVAPEWRGKGFGSGLLRAAYEDGEAVIAEVEPGTSMTWWQRRGARIVTSTYTQPALRPETEPVPLSLITLGKIGDAERTTVAFYREVWNLGEADPLVIRAREGARA